MNSIPRITLILASALLLPLLSCELATEEGNDIDILIICSGGTTDNNFTFDIIIDGNLPYSNISGSDLYIIPAGDIEDVSITTTRNDSTASLSIAIYKDNELQDDGYTNLASCSDGNTSCSNTLSLTYEVDSSDSATASSDSSDSTTSSDDDS